MLQPQLTLHELDQIDERGIEGIGNRVMKSLVHCKDAYIEVTYTALWLTRDDLNRSIRRQFQIIWGKKTYARSRSSITERHTGL